MKTLIPLLTALLCNCAALADVARPVLQSSTTKALVDDLATGAKKMTISATGTLEWVNGGTMGGASYFRTAAGLAIGTNVQAYDADLTTIGTLAHAAGVLTDNGSGTYSYTATSTGGNGTDDSGKIVKFNYLGQIAGGFVGTFEGGPSYNFVGIGEGLRIGSETNAGTFGVPAGGGTSLVWTLPSVTGTLVTTGDTGSVTNTMLAGSIALTKLLQSSATSGQVIAWNGTAWAPATISSGLTIGTTAISGGTSGRLLLSGTTLTELTLGSGVQTALGSTANASGGLLTYGLIGTSGTKIPLLDAANNFASGQRFGGSSGDYIALASSGTRELRLSSNAFSLGTPAWLFAMYDSGSLTDPLSPTIYFRSTVGIQGDLLLYSNIYWNDGSAIIKRAAHDLWMHDPYVEATPSRWMVANSWSYPDANTYEVGVMDWITTSNVLRLGSDVGSSGGTARDVMLIRGGVEKARLGSGGFIIGSGGAAISKVLTSTATLDFDLTAVVLADLTITVTGAAVGDVVALAVPAGSVTTTAQFTAWVSSSNTVTVRCRTSATGEDPPSGTFRATIIQH